MEFNKKLSGVVNKVPSDQAIKLGELGGEISLPPSYDDSEIRTLLTNQAIAINHDREKLVALESENEELKTAINQLTGAEEVSSE